MQKWIKYPFIIVGSIFFAGFVDFNLGFLLLILLLVNALRDDLSKN